MVVSNIFYFHPYLGKWSNLTNIFQMGWNHQHPRRKGYWKPWKLWLSIRRFRWLEQWHVQVRVSEETGLFKGFLTQKKERLLGGEGAVFLFRGSWLFWWWKTLGGDYLCTPKTNWEMMPMWRADFWMEGSSTHELENFGTFFLMQIVPKVCNLHSQLQNVPPKSSSKPQKTTPTTQWVDVAKKQTTTSERCEIWPTIMTMVNS